MAPLQPALRFYVKWDAPARAQLFFAPRPESRDALYALYWWVMRPFPIPSEKDLDAMDFHGVQPPPSADSTELAGAAEDVLCHCCLPSPAVGSARSVCRRALHALAELCAACIF